MPLPFESTFPTVTPSPDLDALAKPMADGFDAELRVVVVPSPRSVEAVVV